MLRIPDAPPLTDLRDFLVEAGYTANRLGNELGLEHGLFASLSNLQPLLERTSGDATLPVLARLFFVGWPISKDVCRRYIPENILRLCLDANVLTETDDEFSPTVVFGPFENVLVVSDAPRLRGTNPSVVIGPSATTNYLARGALRTHCDSLLDIGTGSGVLALFAASFADHVVGTDVNERAVEFSRFNAALNGVHNAEFLAGDALVPVDEKQFSRILANPPFFLAAKKQFIYSDSPLELDGFTRKLAMEAPRHLKEDGVFYMICEWVQVEGEKWEQRLGSWTTGSGCDVFVLLGPKLGAINYCEKRWVEASALHTGNTEHLLAERLDYLRQHRVEYVMAGVLTMRKRKGANWFAALSGELTPGTAASIHRRMEALTLVSQYTNEEWLQTRLRLTPDTVIKQTSTLEENGWKVSVQIGKLDGIDDTLSVDVPVLRAIEMLDGSRTLQQTANHIADAEDVSPDEAETRCIALAKRLMQSSFVMPVAEPQ